MSRFFTGSFVCFFFTIGLIHFYRFVVVKEFISPQELLVVFLVAICFASWRDTHFDKCCSEH